MVRFVLASVSRNAARILLGLEPSFRYFCDRRYLPFSNFASRRKNRRDAETVQVEPIFQRRRPTPRPPLTLSRPFGLLVAHRFSTAFVKVHEKSNILHRTSSPLLACFYVCVSTSVCICNIHVCVCVSFCVARFTAGLCRWKGATNSLQFSYPTRIKARRYGGDVHEAKVRRRRTHGNL